MKTGDISRNTRLLGITSFLVDVSSEMIFPLLPTFLTKILGAPVFVIGLMESLGEFAVAICDLVAGFYSDKLGKRKRLIMLGYSISAVFKGLLVFVTSWPQVILIRIFERSGKGLHESPRDALIGLSESNTTVGKAFGFRKFMDNTGAVLGPLIAAAVAIFFFNGAYTESAYRFVFTIAFIPAMFAVFVLFFIKDKPTISAAPRFALARIISNPSIRAFLMAVMVFCIGQFSIMFFILRANDFLPIILIPILYLIYNASYTIFAMPAGLLVDRFGARNSMMMALLFFLLVLVGFAFFPSLPIFLLAFVLLGFYMSISEVAPQTFLIRVSANNHYGSAIGVYRGLTGMMALPANLIAGFLWNITILSVPATFAFSIIITSVAIGLLKIFVPRDTPGS